MLESYKRLLVRGYKPDILRPLFAKAAAKAEAYTPPWRVIPMQWETTSSCI